MNEVWAAVREKSYDPKCRQMPVSSQLWFLDGLYPCSSKEKAEEYVAMDSAGMTRLAHWSDDTVAHDFQYTVFQDLEEENTTYKYTIEKQYIA